MKKLTPIFTTFLFLLITNSLLAQVSLGAGITTGTAINNALGIQFRASYEFEHPWRVSADYINFFDGYDRSIYDRVIEFNANVHYKLTNNDFRYIYGLVGMNYTKAHVPVLSSLSNSEIGWNLGFGGQFDISKKLGMFSEVKYIVGDASQLVISVGAVCTLN